MCVQVIVVVDILKLICCVSALGKAKFSLATPNYSYKFHLDSGMDFTLVTETGCICPEQPLTLECNVIGVGSTVLSIQLGTRSITCNRHEMVLLHNRYSNGTNSTILCDDGAIELLGWSLRVEDNCYTSQLQVKYNNNFVGSLVSCFYDTGTVAKLVGNFSVPSFDMIGINICTIIASQWQLLMMYAL